MRNRHVGVIVCLDGIRKEAVPNTHKHHMLFLFCLYCDEQIRLDYPHHEWRDAYEDRIYRRR